MIAPIHIEAEAMAEIKELKQKSNDAYLAGDVEQGAFLFQQALSRLLNAICIA